VQRPLFGDVGNLVLQEKQVLEADATLLAILDKVQLYKLRTAVSFEVRALPSSARAVGGLGFRARGGGLRMF
jgi:hypothetical protein